MKQSIGIAAGLEARPFGLMTYCELSISRRVLGERYSGRFEQHINKLHSPNNAGKFKDYKKHNGPYGSFGKFTKFLVPDQKNWADISGSTEGYGKMGEAFRRHIRPNPRQNHRRHGQQSEVRHAVTAGFEGREDVDACYDLNVRMFTHKGRMHIGLHHALSEF
ncbi:hypothetical protein [Bradyrhizobium sp. URHD0069]|uniref:hypothetical protein n=1 Tax=Bradyrhizobium sp. URHD0069 TaxID=1380355 RepID=UPI0012DC96A8|nr:hypothetical protein [Bradyrhizobium sp. URHD0069]